MDENEIVEPIMPTGSGVIDLEVQRELDALAGGGVVPPEQAPMDNASGGPQAESEAHPS